MQSKIFITIIFLVGIIGFGQKACAQCSVTASASNTGIVSGANRGYCPDATIELSAGGSGSVPVGYAWAGPASFTANSANPTIPMANPNPPNNNNGVYTVTVTYSNGCTASSTTRVNVNNKPNANANSFGTYCERTLILLNVTGGGIGGSYVWSGPNGFASSLQNPSLQNVPVSASGAYMVTVTNSSGCTALGVTSINIFSSPIITIAATGGTCAGNNLSLAADPINGTSYQWSGPNNYTAATQTINLLSLTANDNGNYTVLVSDANNCSASTSTPRGCRSARTC